MYKYLLGQLIVAVCGHLLPYTLYKFNGLEFVGDYSKLTALFMILYSVSNLGFPNLFLYKRFSILDARCADLKFYFLLSIGAVLFVSSFAAVFEKSISNLFFYAVVVLFYTITAGVQNILLSEGRVTMYALIRISFYAAPIIIVVDTRWKPINPSTLMTVSVVAAAFFAFLALLRQVIERFNKVQNHQGNAYFDIESIKYAVTGNIGDVLNMILYRGDVLIIGWLGSTEDVGVYSIVKSTCEALYMVPAMLQGYMVPLIAKLRNNPVKMQLIRQMLLVSGVVVFVLSMVFSLIVFRFFYPEQFYRGIKTLLMLYPVVLCQCVIKSLSPVFLGIGDSVSTTIVSGKMIAGMICVGIPVFAGLGYHAFLFILISVNVLAMFYFVNKIFTLNWAKKSSGNTVYILGLIFRFLGLFRRSNLKHYIEIFKCKT